LFGIVIDNNDEQLKAVALFEIVIYDNDEQPEKQ
jgi:hypothetical protein